jgi:hypothetical protein
MARPREIIRKDDICKICKKSPCEDPEFKHLCQLCGTNLYPETNKRFRWCAECVTDRPLPQVKEALLIKCIYSGCNYFAEWDVELEIHYLQQHDIKPTDWLPKIREPPNYT